MKGKWILMVSAGMVAYLVMTGSMMANAEKVVVLPLGGGDGDATPGDVKKGRTFSSKAAGKGVSGALEIREGATLYNNSIGMKFSLIPSGSFIMGSPDGRNGEGADTHRPFWEDEGGLLNERQHVVVISRPFYLQTTEVTQGQWELVMGQEAGPSHFNECGSNCPVEQVSWNDAQNFIDALNALEGRGNCNTIPNNCYSLPTESQWEYAARGGTVTALYSGALHNPDCSPLDPDLDKIGWYCGNAGQTPHPVAQKLSNNWGLYDMSGNVWEWCEDWYTDEYPADLVTDPQGPGAGTVRVIRGGSWGFEGRFSRSAARNHNPPDFTGYNVGFRVALHSGQ